MDAPAVYRLYAKMIKPKRLDGKKKIVALTSRMETDLRAYCRDNGIENESELIRNAIARYIYADYHDETLKLKALEGLRKNIEKQTDMAELFFKYIQHMHTNILAYLPEIDESLKNAAAKSAGMRHEKFFRAFQEALKNDPPFFERLLHNYFTEAGP